MRTEELIDTLATGLAPASPAALERRLAAGLLAGTLVTGAMMLVGLGVRHDLLTALTGFSFWMKGFYTLTLAIGATLATRFLARPDAPPMRWLWLLSLPVVAVAALAVFELIRTPDQEWMALWLGHSWRQCPLLLLTLAVPIFLGLLWAFSHFAPTRLRATGAAAGLASGAGAALIYCLHCPEASASFLLTWYSLGIGLATLFGALLGPRLLRW